MNTETIIDQDHGTIHGHGDGISTERTISGHDDGIEGGGEGIIMKDLQPASSTEETINGDSTGI